MQSHLPTSVLIARGLLHCPPGLLPGKAVCTTVILISCFPLNLSPGISLFAHVRGEDSRACFSWVNPPSPTEFAPCLGLWGNKIVDGYGYKLSIINAIHQHYVEAMDIEAERDCQQSFISSLRRGVGLPYVECELLWFALRWDDLPTDVIRYRQRYSTRGD